LSKDVLRPALASQLPPLAIDAVMVQGTQETKEPFVVSNSSIEKNTVLNFMKKRFVWFVAYSITKTV
jgi:hypothetical protein